MPEVLAKIKLLKLEKPPKKEAFRDERRLSLL